MSKYNKDINKIIKNMGFTSYYVKKISSIKGKKNKEKYLFKLLTKYGKFHNLKCDLKCISIKQKYQSGGSETTTEMSAFESLAFLEKGLKSLDKIKKHLHTIKKQPNAIPYVTSYYKRIWGFCIPFNKFKKLKKGRYRAFIDSEIKNGHLTYGELVIPGKKKEEVFISTNICHPSMANNEISGPVVTIHLAKWIQSIKNRKYTYRNSCYK